MHFFVDDITDPAPSVTSDDGAGLRLFTQELLLLFLSEEPLELSAFPSFVVWVLCQEGGWNKITAKPKLPFW